MLHIIVYISVAADYIKTQSHGIQMASGANLSEKLMDWLQ